MEPRIQYARTPDGARIAYWTLGEGRTFLHLTPGTTACHREWDLPQYRSWFERISEDWRLVRFSDRGEGLSERAMATGSLEERVADLEAVAEKMGPEPFVLFGPWYGGPQAVVYAARHPERVSHLVLWCTFARGLDWMKQPKLQAVRSLVDRDWTVYTEAVAHEILGWAVGEPAHRYAEVLRDSVTPDYVRSFYSQVDQWDVSDYLSRVSVPTLVLHRRQHSLGVEVASNLASAIPNAKLVILEGDSVAPYLGDTESVLNAIEDFAGEAPGVTGEGAASVEAARELLTAREIEVLRLIAAGRSNREIAEALTISINTADRHVSNILTKIGAANRAEAASFAVRNRLA
jgi:pimeloyl-ACP methyl ester carboxylesterase/DNA-binding CsgD family transcriptional regulator